MMMDRVVNEVKFDISHMKSKVCHELYSLGLQNAQFDVHKMNTSILDALVVSMTCDVISRMAHVQTTEVTVEAPRPTFLDWLLRRKRTVTATVQIDVREVVRRPVAITPGMDSILTYSMKQVRP